MSCSWARFSARNRSACSVWTIHNGWSSGSSASSDGCSCSWQGQRLVIFPDDEIVEDFGWCYLFHYNTERYVETSDPNDAMGPGAGPIAVVKKDGAVVEMGSAPGYEDRLTEYGRTRGYL
jgi:hypothetical protein